MKNSTHYRLRALACALLASAAMLGACDDDDPNDDPDPGKKPPVTLTDQIQYDGGDLVGIKSAIYVAEEDGSHTFYLSPTEGLINAEQMKQADDYLRVMVESPKGTVNTASDPFEIEYKDISVKKTTMNDVASVELSADLVTKTRLNLYTYVELKSGKTLIARYRKTYIFYRISQNLICSVKYFFCNGVVFIQVFSHTCILCTLTAKHKYCFHLHFPPFSSVKSI